MLKKSVQKLIKKLFKRPSYFYMRDNPKYKKYSIGAFTYGEPTVFDYGDATLKIGSFCSISSNVTILLGGNHRADWVTTYPFNVVFDTFQHISGHPATKGDVIIGHDVWIGIGTLILSGVKVGDGAILGAHSVVTKDVEPYAIVAGNPARKVKMRFNEEIVGSLLQIKWWEWNIDRIKENIPLMLTEDINEFIKRNLTPLKSLIPTISIITPLYNKAAYITDTIQSVQSQTYTNWEMLVIDNGSTDGSFERVKQIKDDRIHLLQSPKRGPGAARNYGISHATGEWIQFLDADDLLESDHLEKQLQVAGQNPNSEIIVGSWKEFVAENTTKFVLKKPLGFEQPRQSLLDSTIAFAPWAVHAALIKRSALTAEYLWAEELDSFLSEDTAFWFCLLTKCSVTFSNNRGALYRKQTPLCRDEYNNANKWLQGMKTVTSYNIKFLQSRGDSISAKQCEMLMRCFISTASNAHKSRDFITEKEAFDYAEKWFIKCAELGGINSFSLYIRWIFGLRLVQSLIFLVASLQESLVNLFEFPQRSLIVNE